MSGIPLLPGVWLLLVSLVVMVTAGGGRQHGLGTSLELQCPPCDRIHCTPRRAKRLACRGGVTRGICNCCPVCAKVAGEACGGAWDYLGKCDRGLTCIARGPAPELLQQVTSRSNLATKSQGICKTGEWLNNPANTGYWTNVGSMLCRRRRRRDNIDPTLVQCLVFAEQGRPNRYLMFKCCFIWIKNRVIQPITQGKMCINIFFQLNCIRPAIPVPSYNYPPWPWWQTLLHHVCYVVSRNIYSLVYMSN